MVRPLPFRRPLLVAAHPDDETIGAGGILPDLPEAFVVHVTDGSPPDPADARRAGCADRAAYARLRRREAEEALALAGLPPGRLLGLDVPDQGASREMVRLAREIARLVRTLRPDAVLTHAYEGGHPDHDAVAFAARAALALDARRAGPAPPLWEFAGYHAGGTGTFLPSSGSGPETVVPLAPTRRARKRAMLERYRSQREVLRPFLARLDRERFRPAPGVDLLSPPHEGTLHYERHRWGMTGLAWRALAAEALRTLSLHGAVEPCGR